MKNVYDEDEVLKALKSGENIFITGSAGSGKTHLISKFAKNDDSTILTATTGIAALTLGGDTIHRVLGIGIASRDFEIDKIIGKWRKIKHSNKPWDVNRWSLLQSIKTIVIDEVSMLRRDQFELIDAVLSYIKDSPLAFGGVQMVLVGDFFQLPPVVTNQDLFRYKDLKNPYCFQSDLWQSAGFQSFNLKTNYRQDDERFLKILNNIRFGRVTDKIAKILASRLSVKLDIPMEPVKLFARKDDVRAENIACIKKIPGDKVISEADFSGKEYDINILKKECPADQKLIFCKGAQVMMLTNDISNRWVNGTMGIVTDIDPVKIRMSNGFVATVVPHKWERTEYKVKSDGTIGTSSLATMIQFPFKLSYAVTQHRSQGLTLDYVDIDLSNCFVAGQAYVALSRCRTLEGITLRGFNRSSIKADPRVLKFYINGQKT